MKKQLIIVTLFALLFAANHIQAQTYVWKTPQAVSDSISINLNPVIHHMDYFDGYSYYAFWERSVDTLSTDIYVKNMYASNDPQVFLAGEGHHYNNPQIMGPPYYPYDTMFYVLYESDENGNKDIFVVKASASTISDPVIVTNESSDDTHMRCNNVGGIVWESNGKIMYASINDMHTPDWYVTEPLIISDANSYNPVINRAAEWYNYEYIAWEQESDSNCAIYYSMKGYNDTLWSAPIMLYNMGYNRNLHFNNNFWDIDIYLLMWDTEEGGQTMIKGYDFEQLDFFTSDFSQDHYFKPTILPMYLLVDGFYSEAFMAFEWENNGANDILVSEDLGVAQYIDYYVNISDSWQVDQHPQLFEGRDYSYYKDIILIWESERNDNWQLWSSIYSMPMGGIDEDKSGNFNLSSYPNPFTTASTIEFELDGKSKIQITIYNSIGAVVYQFEDYFDQGNHKVTWSPGHLPGGMYYAVMRREDRVSVVKMVKE